MIELIDSHCHLDFPDFDDDRNSIIERAVTAGVIRFINPSVDMISSERATALAQQIPGLFAAVGFHPYDSPLVNEQTLARLTELAQNEKVVAIGEIGLDYYRDRAPKSEQHRAFEAQLSLAKALNLPVIIHQREAAEDTIAILSAWAADGPHPGLVLHAFSGNRAMVDWAVENGFYMGIGGPITFKNAEDYRQIVASIPLQNLLIETDAPYLSPHPYRGKRNEPARVALVAQKLSEILSTDLKTLAQHLTLNTETLFKLPQAVLASP